MARPAPSCMLFFSETVSIPPNDLLVRDPMLH